MKRSLFYSMTVVAALSIVAVASRTAMSAGQAGALVRLQATTPGIAQTGNINVTGSILTGGLGINGTPTANMPITMTAPGGIFLTATQFAGLQVNQVSPTGTSSAIIGWITPSGSPNGSAIQGENSPAGVVGYLGTSTSGVLGRDMGGSRWAGTFQGRVQITGNLGLNTTTPNFPLSFPDVMGDKISFWGQSGNSYGFGIQANLLQIHTDIAGADVAFGFGSSAAMTETMRVKGNGNVGIGTSSPAGKLHVKGGNIYIENGFGGTPTLDLTIGDTDTGFESAGDGQLDAYANNIRLMSVRSGGVGFGTTSPTAPLHAVGNSTGKVVSVQNLNTAGTGIYAIAGTTVPPFGFNDVGTIRGDATGSAHVGVIGVADAYTGVFGYASGSGGIGLLGRADGLNAMGVLGIASAAGSVAGRFSGNVAVTGTVSKGGGSFKIDHPLDPAGKYLYHSFVESPDMMNIYNGEVRTDSRGYATVTMPDWFEALNRDFRYQLTVVDDGDSSEFVQAKIVKRITGNQFTLRTSAPKVTVSWMVTGIRQDSFANAHRIPVEQAKEPENKGYYLYPTEMGQDPSMGIDYQEMARRGVGRSERK